MTKPKHILCIAPAPSDLSVAALLDEQGIAVELTEASFPETLKAALEHPSRWDLILCDATSHVDLGVDAFLEPVRQSLDASLVLIKAADSPLTRNFALRLGAADLVARDDLDHLRMVCERELLNSAMRKEIRELRESATAATRYPIGDAVMLPTIKDMSPAGRKRSEGHDERPESAVQALPAETARIRALIDAGGLTLEFQPIILLRGGEERLGMFETLVRLRDESGHLLMPGEFLQIVAAAGWMSKIDLWILRRALATLKEMQSGGQTQAVLFINVATETLRAEAAAKAIGAFISAAPITPGSVVVEVRKSAFTETSSAVSRLARMLREKGHGLLIEDANVNDCGFLTSHRDIITHIKLERSMMRGLVERYVSQDAVNDLVRCAKDAGMSVIALAVENAALLPMLFSAGVDAIQGHFVSMPYQNLMYPSIQRVESTTGPAWRSARAKD